MQTSTSDQNLDSPPARPKRRASNKIPDELEDIIREKLALGWNKSRIARVFRLNRRMVIRVAREAQSSKQKPNDTGQTALAAHEAWSVTVAAGGKIRNVASAQATS